MGPRLEGYDTFILFSSNYAAIIQLLTGQLLFTVVASFCLQLEEGRLHDLMRKRREKFSQFELGKMDERDFSFQTSSILLPCKVMGHAVGPVGLLVERLTGG